MSKIQFFSNLTVFKNNEGYYSASVENKTEKGEWYKKYLDVRFIDKNVDLENGDIIKCMGFFSLSMNKKTEEKYFALVVEKFEYCLLYTSPSPRDPKTSRMPSSA